MKLGEDRVDKLAEQILDALAEREDVRLQADDGKLLNQIRMTMIDELTVEERLDNEVRKLLDQYKGDIALGRMDYDQLFRRAKQRLINERNLIL